MSAQDDKASFAPKQILACVAEGTLSDNAVRAAVEIAERYAAHLELIHAVATPPLLGTRFDQSQVAAMSADRVAKGRDVLRAHLAHTHHGLKLADTPIEELLHVAAGPAAKVVLDRAEEVGADLLVLGDSGKRKQLDFGGTARALLGKSPCPIWLQTSPPRPIQRILAPVDLSPHSMTSLSVAVDMAKQMNASVTALNCFSVQEFAYVGIPYGPGYAGTPSIDTIRAGARGHFEEEMAAVDWQGVEHETVMADEEPATGILSREDGFDLIAMGTHGRTGLMATLLGGVAYRVLRAAHTPVLAIRMPSHAWLLS
jgi:nucleotide-binding universal stress UspA family protein